MFWNKKDDNKGKLPDLPPINYNPGINQPSEPEGSKNNLPSFPDSASETGFSQAAIKDAIGNQELPEPPEPQGQAESKYAPDHVGKPTTKPSAVEMEEWSPENAPEQMPSQEQTPIPEPPQQPQQMPQPQQSQYQPPQPQSKVPDVFVKIDKFKSARKSLKETKESIEEIDELLKKIRETKQREEQELNSWEKEIENAKSRIEDVTKNIFEKVE